MKWFLNLDALLPDVGEVMLRPSPKRRLRVFAYGLAFFSLVILAGLSIVDGLAHFALWTPWDWLTWRAVRVSIACGFWLALCFATSEDVVR